MPKCEATHERYDLSVVSWWHIYWMGTSIIIYFMAKENGSQVCIVLWWYCDALQRTGVDGQPSQQRHLSGYHGFWLIDWISGISKAPNDCTQIEHIKYGRRAAWSLILLNICCFCIIHIEASHSKSKRNHFLKFCFSRVWR